MNKLRTITLAAALLVASVPSLSTTAQARPFGFHGGFGGGWGHGGWGGGGWGWGGAGLGLGLGLATGALVGAALAAPAYGYGYGYDIPMAAMVAITPMTMPRHTPPPLRRRLTTATDATATDTTVIETTVIETTAMVSATRATAMVFATRATAPLTWDDRLGLVGTGADMLGRDMDVALGKPVLFAALLSKRVLAGTERAPKL
jgi:hypothetical protein